MSFIWFEISIVVYMCTRTKEATFLRKWEINAVDYLRSRMGILKLVLVLTYYLFHHYIPAIQRFVRPNIFHFKWEFDEVLSNYDDKFLTNYSTNFRKARFWAKSFSITSIYEETIAIHEFVIHESSRMLVGKNLE